MGISARKKSGRAFNGAHRDAGVIIHAVPDDRFPSWKKALCGAVPGRKGNGWSDPVDDDVTCGKCLNKINGK